MLVRNGMKRFIVQFSIRSSITLIVIKFDHISVFIRNTNEVSSTKNNKCVMEMRAREQSDRIG